MEKKYKIALIIIFTIILSITVIGTGYFLYKNNLKKNSAEVLIDENLSINYLNGRKFEFNDKEKEIDFSVINDSDEESMYHIILNDVNITGKNVSYKLLENESVKVGTTELTESTYSTISSFINIKGNENKSYKLVLSNPESAKINFTLSVEKASKEDPNFSQIILNNNSINKETKTKVGEQVAVTDEGLIMDIDDNGNTFYFRGNVVNNYVEFAGKIWRIVRINGDGTVKIVLNDNIDKTSIYDDKTTDKLSSLSKKSNNKLYNLLDQWYQNNLKDYDDLISISKYCVDLTKEKENLANYNRINISNNPTFNCLGNTYSSKIGTLSVDEVIYAGACLNESNTYYYLYNPSITESWWTQSAFKDSVEGLYFYEISANGEILLNSTGESTKSVKPVINLNKDVEATGDGTQQNPYKIK